MSDDPFFPPLTDQQPIVDKDGLPTIYFQQFMQKLIAGENLLVQDGVVSASVADKLSVIPNDAALGAGFANIGLDNNGNRYKGLFLSSSGPVARPGSGGGGAIASLGVTNTGPDDTGYLYVQNDDGSIFAGFPDFDPTGGTAGVFSAFGTHPWRFELRPLVTAANYSFWDTGNLSFGTGLTYNAGTGVLSASGASAAWGSITGVLSAQVDLQAALDAKVDDTQISPYGLTLVAALNAASAQTVLGLAAIAASGSGADLVNASVTYGKIQNVSATDLILGRSSAGAGVIQEIACTAAGRALIAGANATAQRTTLGVYSTAAVDLAVTPYEASLTKPAAADFTQLNFAAGTNAATIGDYQRGVFILQNGTPGASGQVRFARHNTVSAGQAFTMTARIASMDPSQSYGQAQQASLILRNSANGRMIVFGNGSSDVTGFVQIFSGYASGQVGQYTAFSVMYQFPWKQIVSDGTNLKFYVSKDGFYWVPAGAGTTIANYLGALDEVGIGMQSIPAVANPHGTVCHSFTFV